MNNFSFVWNRTTPDLDPRSDFINIIPYCFVGIGVVGIILNAMTLVKLKTARRHSSTTRLSLQLLSAMAVADTLCLIALLFMVTVYYFHFPVMIMTALCKVSRYTDTKYWISNTLVARRVREGTSLWFRPPPNSYPSNR
jgi:hypothetical protein